MTINEFIKKTVGVKWVDRACTFDEMDCWGLVILYYRHVLGLELNDIEGYQSKRGTIQTEALPEAIKNWQKLSKPENHCVFLAYIGDYPCHVGVVIDRHGLHAKGNENGGQVQYNRLDAIEKTFTKIEYYKYAKIF